jgi:hypothetical protein
MRLSVVPFFLAGLLSAPATAQPGHLDCAEVRAGVRVSAFLSAFIANDRKSTSS